MHKEFIFKGNNETTITKKAAKLRTTEGLINFGTTSDLA